MRVRIKQVRETLGISQGHLAEEIGISRSQLSLIESGARSLSAERQKAVAKVLGVDPGDLVDFDAPSAEDEDLILGAFRRLDPDQREVWKTMARVFIGSRSETEEEKS